MTALMLQSDNIAAGTTINVDTSALIGGVLQLSAFTPPYRHLPLTNGKTDAGVGLTASAAGGAMGVSRTAGTSLQLIGETTSGNAKTDKVMWEFVLADTYNAGAAIPLIANASIAGGGTITPASCTLAMAAYSEVNGVETALTVNGGTQQITAGGADITWSLAGTGLTPGARLVLELTMLITSASGANTGQINSMKYQA